MFRSPPSEAPKDADWLEYFEVYEQPLKDRLIYQAFHAWWLIAWKVKPINALVNLAEKADLWRHHRTCNDDCGEWTWVATGEKKPGCTYVSLDPRMDCKLFDLDHKNNTRSIQTEPRPRSSGD